MTLLPFVLLLAAPGSAADLRSVVAAALGRSPSLAEALALRREADAAGDEARRSRYPKLAAGGSAVRGDDPLFAFGSLLGERRVAAADFAPDTLNHPGARTAVRGSLEAGVPLFTGFALTRASERAALAARQADVRADAAAQAVRLRALQGFLRGLKDRALLAELDERIAASQREVDGAQRLARLGLVLGSDQQAALAILAGMRAWRARAAAEKDGHDAELAVLVGGPAPEPGGTLRPWSPPPEDGAAVTARPDLRAAALRSEEAALGERDAAWSLRPTLDAFVSVEAAAAGLDSPASGRFIGVRAALPFGDPAYPARRSRARAGTEAAAAGRAALEDAARGEVAARAAGLRGLAAAAPELEAALARARESLELARPLYREGRQSIMEVLRAEEAVARLQEARFETLARLGSEWAALRAAQGRLDDEAVAALDRGLEAAP